MSAEIPRSVLSAHLKESIAGRRVLAAVFTTMEFDPGFFEQEVLPVVLGAGNHHAVRIRLAQLEDALRGVPHGVAVFYDQDHLQGSETPRLDVSRIPVRVRNGVFHPKTMFLLVEGMREGATDEPKSSDGDEAEEPPRSVLVTAMSANLTRSGWWTNVEVAHTEEINAGDRTRLRKSITRFLDGLDRVSTVTGTSHDPLAQIREFLRGTHPIEHRSVGGGLHPHFYDGKDGLVEFLRSAAGTALDGMYLEVISPYFDNTPVCRALTQLREAFLPREVRVFLPRNDAGEALCNERMHAWLRTQPDCQWGRLPADLLRLSQQKDAKERFVHAKVYRFFGLKPKREYLFVGSPNLTLPGHSGTGNQEAGFLVEVKSSARMDWWLEPDEKQPLAFRHESESDTSATGGGTPLRLRFDWSTQSGEAYWDDDARSPLHAIEQAGVQLFDVPSLDPRKWVSLGEAASRALHQVLATTALLHAVAAKRPGVQLLVQESGMECRPSLLTELSPAEIMRYWATLGANEREQLIEEHGEAALAAIGGSEWIARYVRPASTDSFFDRFAGVFQAFAALERTASAQLEKNETRDVICRLFGTKHDSLEHLLDRVMTEHEAGTGDRLVHYVTGMCARQTLKVMKSEHPDLFRDHQSGVARVDAQLGRLEMVKAQLVASDPSRMSDFLVWFESNFMRRAKPVEREVAR